MRHAASGARMLPIILMLLSPVAESASQGRVLPDIDPDFEDQSTTSGEDLTETLFERQYGITSMEVCLAVADDLEADRLWLTGLKGRPERDSELAAWLRDGADHAADKPGFGTLLTCAQIVAAWRSTLSNDRFDYMRTDGHMEQGAVVLDLQISRPYGRAWIAAQPLIRLLTSPGLLPPAAFDGLIIRNARVDGPLLLRNAKLRYHLAYVDVEFAGEIRSNQGSATKHEGTAILIDNSQFSEHLTISKSTVCGDVSIVDSHFLKTVLFRQVEQKTAGCESSSQKERFNIRGSRFYRYLNINRSDMGPLSVIRNDIDTFLVADSRLSRFQVRDNDIAVFGIYSAAFARVLAVNYNRIEGDFFISHKNVGRNHEGRIENIEINSNRIAGGLAFHDFPKETIPVTLDFRSNQVGEGSEICLPADWWGWVLLDGSTYDGTLAVGLSRPSGGWDATFEMNSRNDPPCYGPFFVDTNRLTGDYCPSIAARRACRSEVWLPLKRADRPSGGPFPGGSIRGHQHTNPQMAHAHRLRLPLVRLRSHL